MKKDENIPNGRLRLLAGMIWENRPWRLVPHLRGAAAAAAATAAYAVVTTSFWTMADALSPWRLTFINIIAIAALAIWLLINNNLWEKPSQPGDRRKTLLFNASTVGTLFIGVACMYVILYIVTIIAVVVVIDSAYLSSQLNHSVGLANYATIVWLASSVGMVAGALGSSFESEEAVRKATYSKRELERQRLSRK